MNALMKKYGAALFLLHSLMAVPVSAQDVVPSRLLGLDLARDIAQGSLISAVGVSGAPGGDRDEACARKGLEAVQERLEFADKHLSQN
jgi:uncharacterized protein GlcG (DUF336 family)